MAEYRIERDSNADIKIYIQRELDPFAGQPQKTMWSCVGIAWVHYDHGKAWYNLFDIVAGGRAFALDYNEGAAVVGLLGVAEKYMT